MALHSVMTFRHHPGTPRPHEPAGNHTDTTGPRRTVRGSVIQAKPDRLFGEVGTVLDSVNAFIFDGRDQLAIL